MDTKLYERMISEADIKLRSLLTDVDSFWIKWGYWKEQLQNLNNWINVKNSLPKETFSYGCESCDVLVAAYRNGQWEYGVGYCIRSTNGVEWKTSLQCYPTHWSYIVQPELV